MSSTQPEEAASDYVSKLNVLTDNNDNIFILHVMPDPATALFRYCAQGSQKGIVIALKNKRTAEK